MTEPRPSEHHVARDLVGSRVETSDGRRLGSVVDLEVRRTADGLEVVGLEVSRHPMIARIALVRALSGSGRHGSDPDVIAWRGVDSVRPGRIVLRPGGERLSVESAAPEAEQQQED